MFSVVANTHMNTCGDSDEYGSNIMNNISDNVCKKIIELLPKNIRKYLVLDMKKITLYISHTN